MIYIGPSGNDSEFYEKHVRTYEQAKYLYDLGLNAYEYSFGRGIRMKDETAIQICENMQKYNIKISAHAPYYTNLANEDDSKIELTFKYIIDTLKTIIMMGGNRVVFHPASLKKQDRKFVFNKTLTNLKILLEKLDELEINNKEFFLCPETMGKLSQIGTYEEIIKICTLDYRLIPCFDFGHINCVMQGKLNTLEAYEKIIQYGFDNLEKNKIINMHVHFSKIQYSEKGEIRHLTFEDETYGPKFEIFAEIIKKYNLQPVIICESSDSMTKDALKMKKILNKLFV